MGKGKIILNSVFPNASYNTGDNLYHETINLFRDDDGKYYIHLNPNCVYNGTCPNYVLNIVSVGNNIYKVLSKAIVKKNICPKKETNQTRLAKYGSVLIDDYFKGNSDENSKLYATFECSKIFETKADVYIQFPTKKATEGKEATYKLSGLTSVWRLNKTKIGQCLRVVNIDKEDIKTLQNLIKESSLWQESPIGSFDERKAEFDEIIKKKEENYFSVLGVERKELQYSNAIAKILKYKDDGVSMFMSELGIKNCTSNSFEGLVLREEKNIDLLFRDLNKENGKIVIIENKIDAGLTLSDSKKASLEEQASRIFSDVFKISNEDYKNNSDWETLYTLLKQNYGKSHSQLSKYYIYALCWAKQAGWIAEKIKNDIHCFFLCPEYHKNMYATEEGALSMSYAFADKYILITYKNISDIFKKIFNVDDESVNDNDLTDHQKFIVQDFLSAVSDLAKDRDDSIEVEMIRRFIERHDKII